MPFAFTEQPPIVTGQNKKDIENLRDYLFRMVKSLGEAAGADVSTNTGGVSISYGKDGQQILSPEMIQLWRANQLTPCSRRSFDLWNRKGYSYALGVRTRVDLTLGGAGNLGEFGWDGAAGSWTMIDPDQHLSAFYAMHVRNFGYAYDVIHPTVRSLIYEGYRA